jgi:hypothetical protein
MMTDMMWGMGLAHLVLLPNVGSVWRCLVDGGGPQGSARVETRRCYRDRLPRGVRGWGCVIVAWVGIRDIWRTD